MRSRRGSDVGYAFRLWVYCDLQIFLSVKISRLLSSLTTNAQTQRTTDTTLKLVRRLRVENENIRIRIHSFG